MADQPCSIAIYLPNWVGDAVMFTPTLRAVRAKFPHAQLTLIARPAAAAALTPNPWSDQFILDTGSVPRLAMTLLRGHFDLAVLGPNSFRSALAVWIGRARRRVGYDRDGRRLLLTDRLSPPRSADGSFAVTPALGYYLKLAEHLGCDVSDRRMELSVSDEDAAAAERLLISSGLRPIGPLVFLNPGASFGASKLYPANRFAAVADYLIEHHDAQVVINAAPGEGHIARAVEQSMNLPPLLNMVGRTNSLGLVKGLVARSHLVITNDTGCRHIAAALNVPLITIFGSTDPGWTTIDYPRERLIREDVPCGPCQQKVCKLTGPQQHQCMLKILPERVIEAARELLR